MIYSFTLSSVALAVGLLLIVSHLPGIFAPAATTRIARAFPRDLAAGIALVLLATVWAIWLALTIDLGEFSALRAPIALVAAVLGGLMLIFSREYLAVRGLSAVLLLGANVLLDAAFLRDEPSKLVIVVVAYLWIGVALLFLFSPYRMRDAIAWATRSDSRIRLLSGAGAVFGAVLLALGLWAY